MEVTNKQRRNLKFILTSMRSEDLMKSFTFLIILYAIMEESSGLNEVIDTLMTPFT